MMTWKQFKECVEAHPEVTDDTLLDAIDVYGAHYRGPGESDMQVTMQSDQRTGKRLFVAN